MWETSVINSNYEVNELGQGRNKQPKNVLKGYLDKDGYRIYTLRKDGKQKSVKAHILIASNFCIKQSQENEVNHIDFNKDNNSASNLEWVTHSQNMEHWRKNQSFYTTNEPERKENSKRTSSIPVAQYSLDGKLLATFASYTEAEKQTGVRNGCISLATRGKRHTAGGFVWRDLVEGSTTIENLKDK